jgi:hypothetical protein
MTSDVRLRLLALVGLAVLGIGLAVAGAALGIGETTAADTQVSVSDSGITISNGQQEAVLVENMSRIRTVEVSTNDGRLAVETTRSETGLTDSERVRAVEIAQSNATVQQSLDDATEYTFDVEPVKRLTASAAGRVNGTISIENHTEQKTFTVDDVEMTTTTDGDSVTIRRQSSVVDGKASVRIRGPDGELLYSVDIDLNAEQVREITAWTDS